MDGSVLNFKNSSHKRGLQRKLPQSPEVLPDDTKTWATTSIDNLSPLVKRDRSLAKIDDHSEIHSNSSNTSSGKKIE